MPGKGITKPFVSVIVPVFNEQDAISSLHSDIIKVCQKIGKPFEVIFINDGSTDNSLAVMKSLRPLKIINFRKNFGQTAALDSGIKHARGKYLITMDGDGQNNPKDIPRLIKHLEKNGLDIVSGWRKKRRDKLTKRFASRAVAVVRRLLINDRIHDSGCTLKIFKRECFEDVDLHGEIHRFIPAVLVIKGFSVGEIEVDHLPRTTGKTKYNWKRGIKGNLDILAIWFWKKYAARPLHFFGSLGLLLLLASGIMLVCLITGKIFFHISLNRTALTELTMITFLAGSQFLVFGLLADILSKLYFSKTGETPYSIKEIIEIK